MTRRSLTVAGLLALTLMSQAAVAAQEGEAVTSVKNPNTGQVSDTLIPRGTAHEVYVEHLRALNACDWMGLMAQYPDAVEIHLSGGQVFKGREAVGALFAGVVLPAAEGGLCGITITEESRFEVGTTENVQWVAQADFLAEPYRGSDAYVTDGRYLVAIVSTFEGTDLVLAPAPSQ